MHLPDGFLGPKSSAAFMAAALAALGFAFRKVLSHVSEPAFVRALAAAGDKVKSITGKGLRTLSSSGSEYIGKLAMVSSIIFAFQMFNIPVTGGISGHFIGAVFAAIVLGPWGGLCAMAVVLSVQSFFFSDGGISALGANIFNMGIIAAVGGYFLLKGLTVIRFPYYIALFITAVVSVIAAAAACATEIALSGTYGLYDSLASMIPVHVRIGLWEGTLTVILSLIVRKIMGWTVK
jgi:cobalt/nickel transport system permease protein